jgi:adenosylcobinamide-phosphate synthase
LWSEAWLFFPAQPTAPLVLAMALALDYLLADPWGWPHPVRVMGAVIAWGQGYILQHCLTPSAQRWGGAMLTLALVAGSYAAGWSLIAIAQALHPWAGILMQTVLMASCLGGRSLRFAALEVLDSLEKGDLPQARQRLSRYVGRDTEHLTEPEILRAVIETVAENTPDGATAPLFYAFLGGAPLALAYKASSTLDSMVGYRHAPFTYLGTVPARCEDRPDLATLPADGTDAGAARRGSLGVLAALSPRRSGRPQPQFGLERGGLCLAAADSVGRHQLLPRRSQG